MRARGGDGGTTPPPAAAATPPAAAAARPNNNCSLTACHLPTLTCDTASCLTSRHPGFVSLPCPLFRPSPCRVPKARDFVCLKKSWAIDLSL